MKNVNVKKSHQNIENDGILALDSFKNVLKALQIPKYDN